MVKTAPNQRIRQQQIAFAQTAKPQNVFNPQGRATAASRKARPIVSRQSMHVVLRSDLAKGPMSLRRHEPKINRLMTSLSRSHGVHIYKVANVGNHIHLSLRITKRLRWKAFISGLTGGIARTVGFKRRECQRSRADGMKSFWSARPFTRVVHWGRDAKMIKDYMTLNQLEGDGRVPPRSEMRRPERWRQIVRLFDD